MLFTTASFICLFLPVVLAGFFGLARFNHAAAALWLFVASVFFYGYWMPEFTALLLASITGNFLIGAKISSLSDAYDAKKRTQSKRWHGGAFQRARQRLGQANTFRFSC